MQTYLIGFLETGKIRGTRSIVLSCIAMLIIFTAGCGPGSSDYIFDVADGYVLSRTSSHQVFIYPKGAGSVDRPHIPAKIIKIAWNNRYVLAMQQGLKRRSIDNPQDTYEIPDSKVVNYWILDAEINRVYGPLTLNDFEVLKITLKIPDGMRLQSVGK